MNTHVARSHSRRLLMLSRIARVLIALYLAVWGVETLGNIVMLGMVSSKSYGPMLYGAMGIRGIAAITGILVFVPTATVFLIWFHNAIANLHDARISGFEALPGWSVGSFFVPGANLVVPFGAMRELWNRSHGEDEWQSRASVGEVTLWWMGFVAGTLILFVISALALFDFLTNVMFTTPPGVNQALSIAGTTLWCLSAACLFRIVGKVTAAQQRLSDDRLAFL